MPGPGKDFFEALQGALGDLPIIAEDLGVITPDVVELREAYRLPGMKILQFAFAGGPDDPFLPHHYPENCVVYTGTHDNDTVRGWYERVPEGEKALYRRYLRAGWQQCFVGPDLRLLGIGSGIFAGSLARFPELG